jgi:putative Mg2+ transporter-C (MgtC) family protein
MRQSPCGRIAFRHAGATGTFERRRQNVNGAAILEIVPYLVAALVLGALIGSERQWHHRTAGLKTNALVAVGAASYVVWAPLAGTPDALARIAAQVVSGIGFLGAGVILREGLNVRGLNTAATVWCSAAVGILCGASLAGLAAVVTILILIINLGFQPLVQMINRLPRRDALYETTYAVTVKCAAASESKVRSALTKRVGHGGLLLNGITAGRLAEDESIEIVLRFHLPRRDDAQIERLLDPLLNRPDVTSTHWTIEAMSE